MRPFAQHTPGAGTARPRAALALALAAAMTLTAAAAAPSSQPAPQGAPAPKPLSAQTNVTGLVRITCDPAILPLDDETVQVLLASPGVLRPAIREAFASVPGLAAMDPAEFGVTVVFHQIGPAGKATSRPGGRYAQPMPLSDTLVGSLLVDVGGAGQGAVELLPRICSRLQAALKRAYETKMAELTEQFDNAAREATDAVRGLLSLADARDRARHEHQPTDLSPETLLAQSTELEKERQRLDMEFAGQKARRDALQQRIADIGRRATASAPANDPMVQAMKVRLESMRNKLQVLKQQRVAGLAGDGDVLDCEAQVAMAEAELAQQIRKAAGGDALVRLNDELADLAVDAAQKQAQLEQVRTQLERNRDLLARAGRDEPLQAVRLSVARQAYQAALMRQDEIGRMRRALRPPVVLLVDDAGQ